MERRELLKGLVGGPIALAGVSDVKVSALALEATAVKADMTVYDRGDGERFTLTLMQKPWPKVGDVIAFAYEGLELRGTVTAFHTEPIRGSDRVFYHVEGKVDVFMAKDAKEPQAMRESNWANALKLLKLKQVAKDLTVDVTVVPRWKDGDIINAEQLNQLSALAAHGAQQATELPLGAAALSAGLLIAGSTRTLSRRRFLGLR